jgi:hypothetical protein
VDVNAPAAQAAAAAAAVAWKFRKTNRRAFSLSLTAELRMPATLSLACHFIDGRQDQSEAILQVSLTSVLRIASGLSGATQWRHLCKEFYALAVSLVLTADTQQPGA